MAKHTLATALLTLALAACGGKSRPAAAPAGGGGGGETKAAADCCCEFIEETMIGDGSEDTAENQVSRLMSSAECQDNSGSCVGADACAAGSDE